MDALERALLEMERRSRSAPSVTDKLAQEMTHRPFVPANIHPLDVMAMATTAAPVLGDVLGALSDLRRFVQEPESRTPGNFALSGLGLLPFVPPLGSIRGARNAIDIPAPSWNKSKQDVPVLINPTQAQLNEMFKKSDTLRVVEVDGAMHVWDANDALHEDVLKALGAKKRTGSEGLLLKEDFVSE